MLRFVPGIIGAVAAMIAFWSLGVFDFSWRALAFFVVYIVVTVAVDTGMSRYGRKPK